MGAGQAKKNWGGIIPQGKIQSNNMVLKQPDTHHVHAVRVSQNSLHCTTVEWVLIDTSPWAPAAWLLGVADAAIGSFCISARRRRPIGVHEEARDGGPALSNPPPLPPQSSSLTASKPTSWRRDVATSAVRDFPVLSP